MSAIQILPQNIYTGPGKPKEQPKTIGQSFLSGFGRGLERLAESKLEEVLHHKEHGKRSNFWKALNIPDSAADALAGAPIELQKSVFDRLENIGFGGQGGGQNVGQELNGSAQQDQGYEPDQMNYGQQGSGSNNYADSQGNMNNGVTLSPTKSQQKQLNEVAKQNADKFKYNKDYTHNIIEGRRGARSDLKDISRLKDLSKSGELSHAGTVEFLNRAGLSIPALLTPESEEFQKIQANFLRNAKQYFGGRISNYEVEQFLKTIPSLSQSQSGRDRILDNLKYMAQAANEYYNVYEEVLKENKGIPPYELEQEVERRAEKRMDALYKQLKSNLDKPLPKTKTSDKLLTAAGAIAGSAVKPLAAAALGGLAGSAIPGVGTLGGAALGGGAAIYNKLFQ